MTRKLRHWDRAWDDDPGAGLINLFDVWVAFSMALLLALVSYLYHAKILKPDAGPSTAVEQTLEALKDPQKVQHFRPTDAALNGEGTRLGVAYQLKNGEVVYVPDGGGAAGEAVSGEIAPGGRSSGK